LLTAVGLLASGGVAYAGGTFVAVPQSAFSYYYGFTSQHLHVLATLVYGKKLWDFQYAVKYACSDGTTDEGRFDWPSTAPPRPIKHGSFSFTDKSFAKTKTTVNGHVKGKTITGSFTLTSECLNSTITGTATVTYKLTRGPFRSHW
jgi:hypothetical protein